MADRSGEYAAIFAAFIGATFALFGALHGLNTPTWVCLVMVLPLAAVWLFWKIEDKLAAAGVSPEYMRVLSSFDDSSLKRWVLDRG